MLTLIKIYSLDIHFLQLQIVARFISVKTASNMIF
uniref:Uncharacterized protein n=1 Tax=Anguilla anguilla TaxID=7936 RepID=A0A0E9VVZ5_ANGAN